ncbi:MAG: hypothetical protein M0Q93_12840 [Terrimicrobiaceae bacterium]|nr:hypothetical protein [Terrimicrobiaceae bacterium]
MIKTILLVVLFGSSVGNVLHKIEEGARAVSAIVQRACDDVDHRTKTTSSKNATCASPLQFEDFFFSVVSCLRHRHRTAGLTSPSHPTPWVHRTRMVTCNSGGRSMWWISERA